MWMIVVALLGCAKECEYAARCDGNMLQTCSLGVDQMFGSGESERLCEGVNPVCVEVEEDVAFCARSASATCDDSLVHRCEDDSIISCQAGYEVAEDCALNGPDCLIDDGEPVCAQAPLTACVEASYPKHCEGTSVVSCHEGRVEAFDCDLYEPGSRCAPFPNGSFGCEAR
jgi:hypothetical protein